MITLGDKVKDKITGLTGIATERREFLNGCVQYAVQGKVGKDNKMIDAWYIDEQQLEVAGKPKKVKKSNTGGPMSKVQRL